jgi:very-short-patch-repair endonuclease
MRSRTVDTIQPKTNIVRVIKKNVIVSKLDVKIKSNSKKVVKDVVPCDELSDVEDCDEMIDVDNIIDEDNILEPTKCIYGGSQKRVCNNDLCIICYNKSFASSPKVHLWSKNNNKNPRSVTLSSHTKYLFNCDVCNHEIQKSPDSIKRNEWCIYCVKKQICFDDKCEFCKNNSFESSDKARFWSSANNIRPRDVPRTSHTKYLFDCDVCKHTFCTTPNVVTKSWCPYCSHNKICANNDCTFCWENSFASVEISRLWSSKNNINPRDAFKTSHAKYIFNCEFCDNEYINRLSDISNGKWCQCKNNKTETKLKDWFYKNNIIAGHQIKYEWCKSNRSLPFDFIIESLKLIIELDGPQHFMQISNWKTPEETIKNDVYKMKCAIENGYIIIRLLQDDVWRNKNDWEQKLKKMY